MATEDERYGSQYPRDGLNFRQLVFVFVCGLDFRSSLSEAAIQALLVTIWNTLAAQFALALGVNYSTIVVTDRAIRFSEVSVNTWSGRLLARMTTRSRRLFDDMAGEVAIAQQNVGDFVRTELVAAGATSVAVDVPNGPFLR